MPQRKMWSQGEDQVLRYLKEQRGERKWSLIARQMQVEFGMAGRTGKQCRQRYHNHLDGTIVFTEWSAQEQETLFLMHEEVGNRWSVIALRLAGRSDNCVKNHFYSKLRKGLRKLNKIIHQHYRLQFHQLKISTLYKILEICECRFKTTSKYDEQLVDQCVAFKNKLYKIDSFVHRTAEGLRAARDLIVALSRFQFKVKKSRHSVKQHKDSATTSYSQREEGVGVKEEQKPFYQIFKRVCEEIMLKNM